MFNVAREQSLGTWFSVVQAAVVGLVLLAIPATSSARFARNWGWLVLAAFFLYISADDAALIHERVGGYFGKMAEGDDSALSGIVAIFPSYNWQWVYAPVFGLFGLFILLFVWRELPETRQRMTLLLAFCCWAAAIGIDFVEGREGFFEAIADSLEVKKYTVSHPFLMVEEFLEMFGTTLFLSLFVEKLVSTLNQRIQFLPAKD